MENTDKVMEPKAIEQMCIDFLKRTGINPDAVDICRELIRDMENGNTCLYLDDAQVNLLQGCSVVSTDPASDGLFILDGKKLFTRRIWNYEQTVRTKLMAMKGKIADVAVPDDDAFNGLNREQRNAIKVMCENRFSILTGGPGTGKTYTIARAVKLAQMNLAQDEELQIGLAAPTGKAAARVNETMLKDIATLGLKVEKAVTIHSLLESEYTGVTFKHNHDQPLELKWLIIDEASMIDLPLMAKLLDALPENCRLTLVGDANQLASVEAGRVFSDLCGFDDVAIAELTESRRFQNGGDIDRLAKAINSGRADDAIAMLRDSHGNLYFQELTAPAASSRNWSGFEDRVLTLFGEFAKQTDAGEALKYLNDCRILCAIRKGPFGVNKLNEYLTSLLKKKYLSCPVPVMITKNDNTFDVHNGDVGVRMLDNGILYLPGENGSIREIQEELLSDTETAFASTVHKSQGSEYNNVIIVLPADEKDKKGRDADAVLSRELLYTAITRTREKVYLFSGENAIRKCCLTKIKRNTGFTKGMEVSME